MGEENEGLNFNSVIFRAYDIRGVFGVELTCEVVHEIAKAIGTMVKGTNTMPNIASCQSSHKREIAIAIIANGSLMTSAKPTSIHFCNESAPLFKSMVCCPISLS